MTLASPIPKNLRSQMIQRLETAPESDLLIVHDALLHAEKLKLLDEISEDAERERADGKWDRMPELILQVREKLRRA